MFSLRAPSAVSLERLVASQRAAAFTYDAVGSTAATERPAGYRHDRWALDLGPDESTRFDRCVDALHVWAPQRGAGIAITPDRPVESGMTFALVIRLPLGFVTAAGRVVYVVDERDCSGFAYGTLPSHPEEGEEAFLVRRRDGRVWFEVVAFSRPSHRLARLGGPVTRWLQVRTNNKYLDAMRRAAAP